MTFCAGARTGEFLDGFNDGVERLKMLAVITRTGPKPDIEFRLKPCGNRQPPFQPQRAPRHAYSYPY